MHPDTRRLTPEELAEVMARAPIRPLPPPERARMGFGAVLCIVAAAWTVGLVIGMAVHKVMIGHIERTMDAD